ncbi:MAG: penicillin-binding protein 1A [Rickettsiales bacterium]|nr:penicillin-binding protein 1A [Rickettsiales bacterium]
MIIRAVIGLMGWMFSLFFTLTIIGVVVGILVFNHYSKDLPDYRQLANYDPATVTRLYASDGRLLAEYATEKRVFVPLSAIPKHVRHAFISAEDKNFYEHTGIDISGIARAVRDNVIYYGQGKSLVGGSTITQQVVKNFLLSSEKSLERKIKEAILALRITDVYSKDKILELYLNEIYLGGGSYGVAAAAQNYFNKSLGDITIEEAALLAALPKAPSEYNPRKNYDLAKQRRDWVINRMAEDKFITEAEKSEAVETPITLLKRDNADIIKADFFAEEVRRWLSAKFGSQVLYEGGLVVKTTLDPKLQTMADGALRKALIEYDRRRGYRGPITKLTSPDDWKKQLEKIEREHAYHLFDGQRLAVAIEMNDKKVDIAFSDGTRGIIPFALMKWTRKVISDGVLGPDVKKPSDVVKKGDVLLVGKIPDEFVKILKPDELKITFDLQQIPEVNGAMVVADPHTGRILAMSGGYAYGGSEFNRATQAKRQPGSSFKPFVYMTALENGFTPSTMLLDAPIEMSQGEGLPTWKPQNYHDDYLGSITLRVGLEKSRNTVTVRLAQILGIDKVIQMGERMGIYQNLPRNFSIVLGAAETSLIRMVNAYGMIVNGGRQISPSLIERIDDRHGGIIYRRDGRSCNGCVLESVDQIPTDATPPQLIDDRAEVLDPRIAYQMTSILEGAALRGTGSRAYAELKRPVAGKTGTTNDSYDTWFVGFTPDLVAGVFIGYDKPRTLGKKETGASVALPAFISFMKEALADKPSTPFRIPRGIQLVSVDLQTGEPLVDGAGSGRVITEAFMTGDPVFIPGQTDSAPTMIDGEEVGPTAPNMNTLGVGTGGLY